MWPGLPICLPSSGFLILLLPRRMSTWKEVDGWSKPSRERTKIYVLLNRCALLLCLTPGIAQQFLICWHCFWLLTIALDYFYHLTIKLQVRAKFGLNKLVKKLMGPILVWETTTATNYRKITMLQQEALRTFENYQGTIKTFNTQPLFVKYKLLRSTQVL